MDTGQNFFSNEKTMLLLDVCGGCVIEVLFGHGGKSVSHEVPSQEGLFSFVYGQRRMPICYGCSGFTRLHRAFFSHPLHEYICQITLKCQRTHIFFYNVINSAQSRTQTQSYETNPNDNS
jgi:hypothetical protein